MRGCCFRGQPALPGLGLFPQPVHLQVGTDAGQKLLGAEGLHKIIVGAGFQAFDSTLFTRPSRQHDDGHAARARVRPHRLHQAEPVEIRHHHVGEDQVRRPVEGRSERSLPVRQGLDVVVLCEQAGDVSAHVGVVVGDQNAGPVADNSCGWPRADERSS